MTDVLSALLDDCRRHIDLSRFTYEGLALSKRQSATGALRMAATAKALTARIDAARALAATYTANIHEGRP